MSGILFDANGEYIDHGSAAFLNDLTSFTVAFWHYTNTIDTKYRHCICKTDDGTNGWGIAFTDIWDSPMPNTLQVFRSHDGAGNFQRAGGSDNLFTLNTWYFTATYVPATGTAPSIYNGSLTSIISDVTEQNTGVGAGAVDSDAAYPLRIGATQTNTTNKYRGTVAFYAIWNGQVTLGQLKTIQFNPARAAGVGDCRLLSFPGLHGASSVTDLSGTGNTGTITNASASSVHLPVPFCFGFDVPNPYAVAAAGVVPQLQLLRQIWGA